MKRSSVGEVGENQSEDMQVKRERGSAEIPEHVVPENAGVDEESGDSDIQEIEQEPVQHFYQEIDLVGESVEEGEEDGGEEGSLSGGEEVEDETIRLEDLRQLNIRKSEQKNLKPLKELCLTCVSNNLEFFSRMEDPFGALTDDLLESLSKKLEARHCSSSPDVVPLLLTEKSSTVRVFLGRELRLNVQRLPTFWTSSQVSDHFERVEEKCKAGNMVKVLDLSLAHREFRLLRENGEMDPVPSLPLLHSLLQGVGGSLRELTLYKANIGDCTMSLIAKTCPNLNKLDVSGNEGITEHGIYLLSVDESSPGSSGDDASTPLCQSLTFLSLLNTVVNPRGLSLALLKLPMLTHLEHGHINKGIAKFIELNEGKEIKLETLCVTYEMKHQFPLFVNIMKNIKKLTVNCGAINLVPLRYRNNMTDLTIICYNEFLPSSHIIPLITKNNINITRLNIQEIQHSIDVSVIGNLCRNLEEFTWKNNTQPKLDCEYVLNDEHFSKLKNLELEFLYNVNIFPNCTLINMLSSPCLEEVTVINISLEHALMDWLIHKAKIHRLVFSNLRIINLSGSTFYYENLRDLICVSPRLREVHVTYPPGFHNPVVCQIQDLARMYDIIFTVNGCVSYY